MRAFLCLILLSLVAGCATTTGEPVFRLRPKKNPETGQRDKEYSGNFDLSLALPNFDDPGGDTDALGLSLSARPTSWWIAPEIGISAFDEGDDGNDLDAIRASAGGRVSARFTEMPLELYFHGGVSYLDADLTLIDVVPAVSEDDSDVGYYAGVGSYLFLGSTHTYALGVGYRIVDHDWEIDDWGEIFVTVGWAW